jgi:hypothetical protein
MAAGKIDLKARLGKKSLAPEGAGAPSPSGMPPGQGLSGGLPGQGLPGPSIPGPGHVPHGMGPGPGVPLGGPGPAAAPPAASRPPAAPLGGPAAGFPAPAGMAPQRPAPGSSIPAPPGFGRGPSQAPAGAPVASAAPVAARPAVVAARPAPQGIRLDAEDLAQAQKASSSKAKVLALGAGLVALVVGFGVGSLYNGNQGAKAAMEGAGLLVQEIGAANEKATEMNELLKAAAKKVKAGGFPAEEVEKLGALDIPFDGTNLMNKGIGRYNPTAMTLLLQYSTAVQNAKDQKDKVRRLLGGLKGHIEAAAVERANPQFHWGVKFESTPMGPVGKMQLIKPVPIKDAKDEKYRWPKEFEAGGSKLARYEGEELKSDPFTIPVEPETEALVCPENLAFRAMGALLDTSKDLEGDQTPGSERAGVIELGNKAMESLKKINSGGGGA